MELDKDKRQKTKAKDKKQITKSKRQEMNIYSGVSGDNIDERF
jgi:hypothetical protein